jgi:hypothetical protein
VIAKVTVLCDNPAHPRGRVSTVAVYRRFPEGWEREYSMRPPAKRTRRNAEERKRRRVGAALDAGDNAAAEFAMALTAGIRPASCPDCGAGVSLSRLALEIRLEAAAVEGEAQITLCQLHGLS